MAAVGEDGESDADGALGAVPDVSGRILAVIVGVVAVALLVSLVVLLDGSGHGDLGPSRPLASTPSASSGSGISPTTAAGAPTTTAAPTPTTSPEVTTIAPRPATTAEPDLPAGWIDYRSPKDEFAAALPGEPMITEEPDAAASGASRTGYSVAGPAKTQIAIEVTQVGPVADPDRYLATVITKAAGQLGASSSVVEPPFAVEAGRAQDATLRIAGGEFRMRVEYVGEVLHVVSMAVPTEAAPDASVAAAFQRIVDSYRATV